MFKSLQNYLLRLEFSQMLAVIKVKYPKKVVICNDAAACNEAEFKEKSLLGPRGVMKGCFNHEILNLKEKLHVLFLLRYLMQDML